MSIHGWLLWNQLSGVDGRMGKQHVWKDMLRICRPLWRVGQLHAGGKERKAVAAEIVGGANPGEKRDMGSVVAFREGCRDLLGGESFLCWSERYF